MSVSGPRKYTPRLRLGSLAPAALFLYLVAAPSAALETIAKQAILMDAETSTVLFEKDADDTMPPSSMSKLMTVYMVFERLKNGSLTLDDKQRTTEVLLRGGAAIQDLNAVRKHLSTPSSRTPAAATHPKPVLKLPLDGRSDQADSESHGISASCFRMVSGRTRTRQLSVS